MSLFRWSCCHFALTRPALTRTRAFAILFTTGVGHSTRAQTPSQQSEFRVFVGYENQRADLIPSTLSALNGGAISLERVTPRDAVSPVLDIRVGHRSGLYFGFCELCPSPPTTPNDRASNIQALLLAGARASLPFRGARAFVDLLAGAGYLGWSSPDAFPPEGKGTGSPLVEAGAGIDAPIHGRISARARASLLASDWDDNPFEATRPGWRQHRGLSAGLVLRL
jgi:hypothetical protein